MQRVGNIIKKFVSDYGLETGLTLTTIKNQWDTLVGPTLAAHTFPDIIKGKTIFITVDTPQWMHHLSFYKQEILEKLKHYKIDNVRFKIGRLSENLSNDLKNANHCKLTEEDSQYIEDTVKNIKDDELKERFKGLLTSALRARRK